MKWNVICNAEDRFSCFRAFLQSHVRASMHKITSLELLRTLMLCLVQLSKRRESKDQMLKSFSLSERKLVYAIIRVKLKYMKDVSFSWNEMLFAMQKTYFHVLELCCTSRVRAFWKASFSVRESWLLQF